MQTGLRSVASRACGLALAVGVVWLAPPPALAARPMVTDDARLTDDGACQVESWVRLDRSSTELWALPACNPTGNLEITIGGAFADNSTLHKADDVFQLKTLLRPLETNGWGVGLAAGFARHIGAGIDEESDRKRYLNLPVSKSLLDDRVVLHLNLGLADPVGVRGRYGTWGLGSEIDLDGGNNLLIVETFHPESGAPFYQFGLRHWIVPGRVQTDITYGDRFGAGPDRQAFTVGLRLISPPLFK